jgi:hypothetical protein
MGPGRAALRHCYHLVFGRRRPLHGLYLYRRPGTRLRRRRHRVLRGALHDHDLSDLVSGLPAALVCLPQAQLHHGGRLRAWPFRQSMAGAGGGGHRHRRHHAVYRLQLVGLQVVIGALGVPSSGLYRRPAADHRFHHSGGLHLFERAARAGIDCHRQGYLDLHHGLRRRHLRADPARRLRQDLCRGAGGETLAGGAGEPTARAPTASTRRWRWDRRWRCSSIRIPSPAS